MRPGADSPYNFRNSEAFKRMEAIACRLVLDNQDINLLAHAKVFKEKVVLAVREQNVAVLKSFGLKEIPRPQEVSKYDLRGQLERYRAALEAESRRQEALSSQLEETTREFLEREIELNALIHEQTRLLE